MGWQEHRHSAGAVCSRWCVCATYALRHPCLCTWRVYIVLRSYDSVSLGFVSVCHRACHAEGVTLSFVSLCHTVRVCAAADCRVQALPMQPVLRHTSKPVYPEDLEEGLARYSSALQVSGTHSLLLSPSPSVFVPLSHMLHLMCQHSACMAVPLYVYDAYNVVLHCCAEPCFAAIGALQEIAHSFAGHTVLVVTHGEVGALRQCVVLQQLYPHVLYSPACTVWWQLDPSHACLPVFLPACLYSCLPACLPAAVCHTTTVRAPGRFDGRALQRSV